MQRNVPARGGDRTAPRPCPRCGAPLHASHREYAGRGNSTAVLRCVACGHTLAGPIRSDSVRQVGSRGSRKHRPVDEGPPPNPVIDAELARRLLEELGS